jgi:molybdopterin-guanine dinucleotide biosynthesis protein A
LTHLYASAVKMMDAARVTLAVLAGGAGTRMGMPKSALQINGIPILRYLLERFGWPGPLLLVSGPGNERPPAWELFDREVTDAVAGEGPLRGTLTALENASSELVALVSVDMPGMTREALDFLIEAMGGDARMLGTMFARKIQGSARVEPFPSVLRREARDIIARRLAAGDRAVHELTNERIVTLAPPAEWGEEIWANLNRPADLEAFERSSDSDR